MIAHSEGRYTITHGLCMWKTSLFIMLLEVGHYTYFEIVEIVRGKCRGGRDNLLCRS